MFKDRNQSPGFSAIAKRGDNRLRVNILRIKRFLTLIEAKLRCILPLGKRKAEPTRRDPRAMRVFMLYPYPSKTRRF